MLESDTSTDTVPKHVAIQMLTTLSDSIISMCESTRNVSTFIRVSSAGGSDALRGMGTATTRDPDTSSRVPHGDVRSLSSQSRVPSRAASVVTDMSNAMSPSEIRKAKRKVPDAPSTPAVATTPGTPAKHTSTIDPQTLVTPSKSVSARQVRMASRTKAQTPAASDILTDLEATSLTIMAEYISSTRDDADATRCAEQIMAAVASRTAKDEEA